jgi:hypothetical protein
LQLVEAFMLWTIFIITIVAMTIFAMLAAGSAVVPQT